MMTKLVITFFKIGLLAVGGGLATLPFIDQLSQTTGWISRTDISNMVAIAESTPGPIGINMATYVGYLTASVPGAILAPLALTAPSVIICVSISKLLNQVKSSPLVQSIFASLRPASAALILTSGLKLALATYWDNRPKTSLEWLAPNWQLLLLSTLLLIVLKKYKPHPIILILAAALVGILFKL